MVNPANTQGPNGDGSKSLAKESKTGLITALGLTALGQFVLGGLANLDTTEWLGQWWGPLAVAGLSTVAGAAAAYFKANH